MISHSPKASIRVACRHASSLAYITMPPCHCFDQDLISSPSKDLSFRHTTRQFIRQQREGKSLSLLISAICMEGIADSLHRHITDAHFPALQDRLSLCGTKALWNERRRRVQSETIGSGDENNKTPRLPPYAQSLQRLVQTPPRNRTERQDMPDHEGFPGDSKSLS
jgi:hypothetical protein